MLSIIFITTVLAVVGYLTFRLLKRNNPELRVYRKQYSCSVCGGEFHETLDYCPECAKDRQATVLLHEFFVEVSLG